MGGEEPKRAGNEAFEGKFKSPNGDLSSGFLKLWLVGDY